MSGVVARWARPVAIALVTVAWAAAAHYTSAMVASSSWGAALGLAPFVAIAGAFAWRSPRRGLMLAVLAAAVAGLAAAWPTLERNVSWMYFLQHLGTNGLLCIAFGRTLGAGRVPMCAQLAAMVHGPLSPALARYTRGVTLAWTLFFGCIVTLSLALFAFASREAWSVLANLLTLPLVGLMFVLEYLVRVRVLPPEDRGGIIDAVRAYWRTSAARPPSGVGS